MPIGDSLCDNFTLLVPILRFYPSPYGFSPIIQLFTAYTCCTLTTSPSLTGLGSVDTTLVSGTPSPETASMQYWSLLTSCQLPPFSWLPLMLPQNRSNRFQCTIFTLPAPASKVILKNQQHCIWLPLNTMYGFFPMVLDFMFVLKGCPLEKVSITHSLLGEPYFMIIVPLLPSVLLFHDILGCFICPS